MTEKQYLAKLRNLARQHLRNCPAHWPQHDPGCSCDACEAYRYAEVSRLIQTFAAVAQAAREFLRESAA